MRQVVVVVLLLLIGMGTRAWAQQDAPPEPVLGPPPVAKPAYKTTVRTRPSPDWTQDRSFTSTRFWLLDPGSFEVQAWLRTRFPHSVGGVRGPATLLWQHEVEIGVVPHLQIDIYENLTINADEKGHRVVQQEGVQIEARVAIPSYYGQMFGNPVLYFEFHPKRSEPDRVEFRLLMGGAPTKWFYMAINPYIETNVEPTTTDTAELDAVGAPVLVKQSKFIADMEFGTTAAFGFRVAEWLRLSAELKIGADMLGDENNRPHFVWFTGPGFILKPLRNKYFKIMATCLFALPPTDARAQQFEPLFIVGSQF